LLISPTTSPTVANVQALPCGRPTSDLLKVDGTGELVDETVADEPEEAVAADTTVLVPEELKTLT